MSDLNSELKANAEKNQKAILAPLSEKPNPKPEEEIETPSGDFEKALNRKDVVTPLFHFTWSLDAIKNFFVNLFGGKEKQ